MKIENGLLFVAAYQLSGDPRFYDSSSISACVPIRKISHMKEHPHAGKVYTVLHLDNGDEVIANATIPDIIKLINDAGLMNLFGMATNRLPNPEVVISGAKLNMMVDRLAEQLKGTTRFPEGGMVSTQASTDDGKYGVY